MKIPRTRLIEASCRLTHLSVLVFPGLAGLATFAMFYIGLPVILAVRDQVDGQLGMMLSIALLLPVISSPLLLPLVAIYLIDRRIGIRCPNCNVSLTLRCNLDKVLVTGKCSRCNCAVLLDEDIEEPTVKPRSSLIIPLIMMGAILLCILVILAMRSPDIYQINVSETIVEFGLIIAALILLGWIQPVISQKMNARWEREAESETPQSDSEISLDNK